MSKILCIIIAIIGGLLALNSLATLFLEVPMFYDYLPVDLFESTVEGSTNYMKVVPDNSNFDPAVIWLGLGAVMFIVSTYFIKSQKG